LFNFEVIVATTSEKNYCVAVIGAGPAGLYATHYLARRGINVLLFNRDIKPGGLAEYGIYPTKYKLRSGLLAHFKRILSLPNVKYQGNVVIGQNGDYQLDHLRNAGVEAMMVTIGAQQNKWIGLSGESLQGVFQAQDIVYHYNNYPSHANKHFDFGERVAVIGVGNVMLDILRYLQESGDSRLVTAYARRGPTEVKFDKETLEPVADCIDLSAIKSAVDAVQPMVEAVGRDIGEFYGLLKNAREKAEDCNSGLKFTMQFLRSPRRLIGDDQGRVKAVEFEINQLSLEKGQVIPQGTGELETEPADSVIFSIGSRVDSGFGLPVEQGHLITAMEPRFPISDISYELYNPDLCVYCEDVFVSGWARIASEGVVGLARQDAERGARAVLAYLKTKKVIGVTDLDAVIKRLPSLGKKIVDLSDLQKIWEREQEIAHAKGLPVYKFKTNEAMLGVLEED
jgi:ferredoxin--NADP+ reductase